MVAPQIPSPEHERCTPRQQPGVKRLKANVEPLLLWQEWILEVWGSGRERILAPDAFNRRFRFLFLLCLPDTLRARAPNP